MIELHTLGGLRLSSRDGRSLRGIVGREKRLALLVYLAAAEPRGPCRRDTLAALFWPESSPERARTALRQGLKVLRGALGAAALPSAGDAVVLETQEVSCDAAAFDAAFEAGRFAEAMDLYRGEFLAGFFVEGSPEFDDWVATRRGTFQIRAATAAQRLAAEAELAGDLESAVEWSQRRLELVPDDERAVSELLRCLHRVGRSSEAVTRYRDFARRLRAELQLEPGPLARRWGAASVTATALPTSAATAEVVDRPALSVGMLPLTNLTGDRDLEYLSDGLTEELIAELSRLRGVWVPARTSSFAFKGRTGDTRKIGEALRVRYLVEGSVRLLDQRVRVSAALVEAHSGYRVWSGQLDRPLAEVMSFPTEMVSRITAGLASRLAVRFDTRASRATEVPSAYLDYLRGMHHFMRKSPADFRRSGELFRAAIAADPSYAAPWAGLAHVLVSLVVYAGATPEVHLPEARTAAQRSLELDPNVAGAHTALGLVHAMFDWDWAAALVSMERGVALDPWDPFARQALGLWGYTPQGRHAEALAQMEKAVDVDPISPAGLAYLAQAAFFAGDYERATAACRQALELVDGFPLALWFLVQSRERQGALDEALELAQRLVAVTQNSPVMRAHLARTLARCGRHAEARALLTELESGAAVPGLFFHAEAWLAQGDRTRALEALERAESARNNFLVFAAVDPFMEDLRSEPSFVQLLRRLGLQHVAPARAEQSLA